MYYSPFAYPISFFFFFFFNDTATTEIYTLSLHDALPILAQSHAHDGGHAGLLHRDAVDRVRGLHGAGDRKSTRLNSSHPSISYAVFCLKKKKKNKKKNKKLKNSQIEEIHACTKK